MKEKREAMKSVFTSIFYLLRLIWSFDKKYILIIPITSISKTLLSLAVVLFPKFIIDEITGEKQIKTALLLTVSMAVVLAILRLTVNFIEVFNSNRIVLIKNKLQIELQYKVTKLPFWMIEDPKILDQYQKATGIVNLWQADLQRLSTAISGMFTGILTLSGVAYILLSLNFLVYIVLSLVVVINAALNAAAIKRQLAFYQSCAPHVRKVNYLMNELQENEYAKEIRSYQMQDWLTKKISMLLKTIYKNMQHNINFQTLSQCVSVTMGILQEGASYLYVGWLLMKEFISIGDFTMYITSINNFSASLKDIFNNFLIIQEAGMYVNELRLFLELEESTDSKKEEKNEITSTPISEYDIEVIDLWFKYPGSDNYTLKNINLKINWKEIISIVGDNGAGKSTFIKLFMRLYKPTKGEIRLNGKNIWNYSFHEYVKLIAVVFQDYKTLAFKVNENVALKDSEYISSKEVHNSLKKGGLLKKVLSFPYQENTYVTRRFEEEGVELSGGEEQKLAICHAIYKDSPIMILDEPTANLSPMAEYEVFSKFTEIMRGKTAIYISHRMSSCRLSDRIVVFKNGKIIESGSHDALINQGGEYAKMYNLQAEFYKNDSIIQNA